MDMATSVFTLTTRTSCTAIQCLFSFQERSLSSHSVGKLQKSLLIWKMGRSRRCHNPSVRHEQVKRKSVIASLAGLLLFPCCGSSTTTDHVNQDKGHPGPVEPLEDTLSLSVEVDSVYEGDDISVIDLGEESESAEACFVGVERSNSQTSIPPGVPDDLSSLRPNKAVLPPLKPLLRSTGVADMQKALEKAEAEDSADIPSGFQKSASKKQQHLEKKQKAKLAKANAKRERHETKSQLARKKKLVKLELEKVERSKKRAELEEALQLEWNKVDKTTEEEKAEVAIQKSNSRIETLEREVELLKVKQDCKVVEHDLLSNKNDKGIISKTVRQCKSMRIKRKHSSLERKINDILDEVNSLKDGAVDSDTPAVDSIPTSKQAPIEQDTYDSEQKSKDSDLLSLFVGDSFKALIESKEQVHAKECLSRFQEKCEEQAPVDPVDKEPRDEEVAESESEYSFNFEEDIDDHDETCSEIERVCGSPDPLLYRCTRLVPLHKLLPKPLEVINEETDDDMEVYERGEYVCNVKFYQSCREGDISDCAFNDFYRI